MTSYAHLTADLLMETAVFFVRISQGNPEMQAQMEQNAQTFRHMSDLIRNHPEGRVEDLSHAEMAARLLEDASKFFLAIAENNPPIREQMEQNAAVFGELAVQVRQNPLAEAPDGQ